MYFGFRVTLMVFMALTNCFRKILWTSYVLRSFVKHWLPNELLSLTKVPIGFFQIYK